MSKSKQARFSFGAGVLSPRLTMRGDMDAHVHALKEGTNFIIAPHGGAIFREGFQHVGSTHDPDRISRIFQFHRGGDVSDVLVEVNAGITRYWIDETGAEIIQLVDEDDGDELIDENDDAFITDESQSTTNPYGENALEGLYFSNTDETAIICSPLHPPYYIVFEADGQITGERLPFDRVPLFAYNDIKSPNLATEAAVWRIDFNEIWNNSNGTFEVLYAGYIAREGSDPNGNKRVITFNSSDAGAINAGEIRDALENIRDLFLEGEPATIGVTPIDLFSYEVSLTGKKAGFIPKIRPRGSEPMDVISSLQTSEAGAEEPAWSYPFTVEHNGVYYDCIRPHSSGPLNEPGVGDNWEQNWTLSGVNGDGVEPYWFPYQFPDGSVWEDGGKVYSPWDRGWPEVVVFHQQRAVLMANKDNPTALYGSEIGLYTSFQTGPEDDDPYIFVLDSSDSPQIKWAYSQINLLLGTSAGDWIVSGGADTFGPITPTSIQANKQNFARSHKTNAYQVDTDVYYIEQGKTKVRATTYMRQFQTFSSIDVSLMAEVLFRDGVKRMTVVRTPEVMIVLLTDTGSIVVGKYEKGSGQVATDIAWTPLETRGFVYDLCGYYDAIQQEDYVFAVINHANGYYLERMPYPSREPGLTALSANDIVHLDGWTRGSFSYSTQGSQLYVNRQLAGGANSSPTIGEYPPDDHIFGALEVAANPINDGSNFRIWDLNVFGDEGRCYFEQTHLAYPSLVVGALYRINYQFTNMTTDRMIPIDVVDVSDCILSFRGSRYLEALETRRVEFYIRPTQSTYTFTLRFGAGCHPDAGPREHITVRVPNFNRVNEDTIESTMVGLNHLEGRVVTVLVNDAFQGEYVVDGGVIQLDRQFIAGEWAAGISYGGQLVTYEHVHGNREGVGFGDRRRWPELNVRILDSALPLIQGIRPEDRTPATFQSEPEIVRAGVQDLQVTQVGYGDGSVTLTMDRPYPLHVLGIFGEFVSESR